MKDYFEPTSTPTFENFEMNEINQLNKDEVLYFRN
jgi:hypothetical protein